MNNEPSIGAKWGSPKKSRKTREPPENVIVKFAYKKGAGYRDSIKELRQKLEEDRNSNVCIYARFQKGKTTMDYYVRRKNVYIFAFRYDKKKPFTFEANPNDPTCLGFKESYKSLAGDAANVKIGFDNFRKAVLHSFMGVDMDEDELKNWKAGELRRHIACIVVMIAEAVRFHWLLDDFSYMMVHKGHTGNGFVSDKPYRPILINHWKKITNLKNGILEEAVGEVPPEPVRRTGLAIDGENATKFIIWATHCLALDWKEEVEVPVIA